MVTIYIRGIDEIPKDISVVDDVELEFNFVDLKGSDTVRGLIKQIEHGEWLNNESFIDRFGYKLWMDSMSTGCKAALVAACEPTKAINLRECGYNARDAIVLSLKDGHLIIDFDDTPISPANQVYSKNGTRVDTKIEVVNNGYKFTSLERLNEYLLYEKLGKPNLNNPGIEKI